MYNRLVIPGLTLLAKGLRKPDVDVQSPHYPKLELFSCPVSPVFALFV